MKKIISLIIFTALLTGCGSSASSESSEPETGAPAATEDAVSEVEDDIRSYDSLDSFKKDFDENSNGYKLLFPSLDEERFELKSISFDVTACWYDVHFTETETSRPVSFTVTHSDIASPVELSGNSAQVQVSGGTASNRSGEFEVSIENSSGSYVLTYIPEKGYVVSMRANSQSSDDILSYFAEVDMEEL